MLDRYPMEDDVQRCLGSEVACGLSLALGLGAFLVVACAVTEVLSRMLGPATTALIDAPILSCIAWRRTISVELRDCSSVKGLPPGAGGAESLRPAGERGRYLGALSGDSLETGTRWRRGWDSNPRATFAAAGFQVRYGSVLHCPFYMLA
jgi:hypothetical protein